MNRTGYVGVNVATLFAALTAFAKGWSTKCAEAA